MVTLNGIFLQGGQVLHLVLDGLCGHARSHVNNVCQTAFQVFAVASGILNKVAPSFGSHGTYAQTTAYTHIFVKEVSTFNIHNRGRVEIHVKCLRVLVKIVIPCILLVTVMEGQVLQTIAHAH